MRVVHPLEIWELVADELTTSSVTVWDGRLVSQRGGNSSVFPLEKAHQKSSRREHKFLNNLDPGVSGRRAPLGSNDLEKNIHQNRPSSVCGVAMCVCLCVKGRWDYHSYLAPQLYGGVVGLLSNLLLLSPARRLNRRGFHFALCAD